MIQAAVALDALGGQPDPEARDKQKATLLLRRKELVQEILIHGPMRNQALSALISLESDEERSEVLTGAAVTAHALTCQPDELLQARTGERHAPKALMNAVTGVLRDMERMGLDKAQSRTLHNRNYLLQSLATQSTSIIGYYLVTLRNF